MYIWWNYFQWDYITNLYQHHLLYCLSPGALNFFFVGRDVRGGSPKWPGAFVFRGGYHPRKTSCKSTVGANRLAGPIMSWTDHYFSVNDSPICIWPKMRTSGAAFFAFLTHICYRPNTCQLATVTVGCPPWGGYLSMIWVGTCRWDLKSRPIFIPSFAEKWDPFLYQSHKF